MQGSGLPVHTCSNSLTCQVTCSQLATTLFPSSLARVGLPGISGLHAVLIGEQVDMNVDQRPTLLSRKQHCGPWSIIIAILPLSIHAHGRTSPRVNSILRYLSCLTESTLQIIASERARVESTRLHLANNAISLSIVDFCESE